MPIMPINITTCTNSVFRDFLNFNVNKLKYSSDLITMEKLKKEMLYLGA